MKIIVDFTCVVQFRHPNELGGFYWCLNLVLSQASCFVAAKLYIDNVGGGEGTVEKVEDEEGKGFPPSAVMAVIQAAFALWLASLLGFLVSIDKNYLHTFFDLASAKQHATRKFRAAATDYEKFAIFTVHPSYRSSFSIRKEGKEWMSENYEVFDAEKPEWWTELLISTIPDDFIPKEELKLLDEQGAGGKRKKSVVGLGGRVSFAAGVGEGGAGGEEGKGLAGVASWLSLGGKGAAAVAPAPTPTPGL